MKQRNASHQTPRIFVHSLLLTLLISHLYLKADGITTNAPTATGSNAVTVPADAPRFTLGTDTTQVALRVSNDTLYLEALLDTQRNWNWLADDLAVPMPDHASGLPLKWHFQEATTDQSQGTRITFRFTSDAPALELSFIWWAHPGTGPVEYKSVIRNTSGKDMTFLNKDLISADLQLVADAQTTLHRFAKLADYRNDERAETPVISTSLCPETSLVAYTRNAINNHPADIPFEVFDVGSSHGLYLGYEWSFGRFEIGTRANPLHISYRALLWKDSQTVLGAGRSLTVPPMYLGTYVGDLDDGGNQFKRWFWKYKITATLRDSPGEPLLEYCVPGNEAGLTKFFADYPVADWGGELAKVDIDWLPKSTGAEQRWFGPEVAEWNADPVKWPNGMTARQMALKYGQKLSLYMPHSYEYCDLATDAGREKEKAALLTRYDAGMFDYYRSDFIVEGSIDYLKHEGFMDVLDTLIAERPNFRYEHCSAGGTLKDFSTLQRITFMTTEDSATPEGHRKAMYASTYMINPVQLKGDIAISGGPGSNNDPVWVRYCLRTGFMGANMASSWGTFTPAMIAETKKAWPLYTSQARPLLRGADVYHILPPCNGIDWDGLQYFNPGLGSGMVLLFKPSARISDSRLVKLKGLARTATYSLTFQDRTSQNITLTGTQLMDEGITVTGMTGDYASEIIWLKDLSVIR